MISYSFLSLIMKYHRFINLFNTRQFCVMLVVMVHCFLSTESMQYTLKSNHESNRRNFEPLNKNYCKITSSQNDGRSSDLISSIIHEMQKNADGTLSCISIFANEEDSFAQGTMNLKNHLLLYLTIIF